MEPRARAARHKGSLNFGLELENMLQAFGAPAYPSPPLPHDSSLQKPYTETVRVLDEILTDFIIETCHEAVAVATYSGRAKLKMADFEWVLRKDVLKLGHVRGMFEKKRDIDSKKKAFDVADVGGEQAKVAVENLTTLAEEVGEEGTRKGIGRGRGRRKKREIAEVEDAKEGDDEGTERGSKKAKSDVG